MTKWLALLAALFFAPSAVAHASPNPLDNEVHLLSDEASDNFAYYDGFDIQDLFIREGYIRDLDQSGIIVRPILYGGFGPAPIAAEMRLEFSFSAGGASHTFSVATDDGLTWAGDAHVVESSMEAVEAGQFGTQGSIQWFIPYGAFDGAIGDAITDVRLVSLADADPRDQSPGGFYLPGSGGLVELPGDGAAVNPSYTLTGPAGYTQSKLTMSDGIYTAEVTNLITVIGQHIILDLPDTLGWTFERIEANPQAVDPGVHPAFTFRAIPSDSAGMATLRVTSDLGGLETLVLHPPGHSGSTANGTSSEPTVGEEAPAPFLALLIGLVILAARRR